MTYNIDKLIPHKPPMRLVDKFISFENETVHCQANIMDTHLFLSADKSFIQHWIGIEIMAQTAATYGKVSSKDTGDEPAIAFLLSIRNYRSDIKKYKIGSVLDVFAECLILDSGTGVFSCRIELDGEIVSSVTINAHQPQSSDDANKIIKRGS